MLRSSRRSTRWNKEKTRLVRMLLQEDGAHQETSRTGGSVSIAAELREIKGKKLNRGNETRKTK